MAQLSLTVDIGDRETPTSFASRLAARNFVSARVFCADMGLRFQAIVDGRPDEIQRLADLAGADGETLIAHSFVRQANRDSIYRGQTIAKLISRRGRVYTCPACLADDIRLSDLPASCAPYGRSEWNVAPVLTCARHDMALIDMVGALGPQDLHDFSRNIVGHLPDIDRTADHAVRRPPSEFERYLLARFDGLSQSPWLDGLQFQAATRAVEIVGAVAAFGKRVDLDCLNDDDRRRAGAEGFAVLKDGVAGLDRFMTALKAEHVPKAAGSAHGPQAVYGKLYMSFAQGLSGPAYDPIREAMKTHILNHFPLGPEDELFGEPVAHRRFHSIRTASVAFGMHPKRLRKLIEAEGLIADPKMKDRDVLFDAEVAVAVVAKRAEMMTLRQTEVYLNAPRPMAHSLILAGLIPRHSVGTGMNEVMLKSELDQFLIDLYRDAVVVDEISESLVDVATAAKKTNSTTAEIVQLVRDERLERVCRTASSVGVLGLLVEVEEVRLKTRLAPIEGLLLKDAKRALQVSQQVIENLIDGGHLRTVTQRHPVKRALAKVIPIAELERFQHTYASLFSLARARGTNLPVMKRELETAGIKPVLEGVGATFYLRQTLAKP